MIKNVRLEHLFMLLRGLLWQILRLRFGGIILMGRGASIRLDRSVRLKGIVKIGNYATLDLRFTASASVGPGFSLGDFSIFRASGSSKFTCPSVEVGENVSFGPYCNIGGGFGLFIGPNVIAGPYVSVHPEEHKFSDDQLIRNQSIYGKGIRIEDDCWLGSKSTILDGSCVSAGTVLGAGALVAGVQTDPYGVYVGIPARLVRLRDGAAPRDSR
jgi:acetyltransferase-like isoleucine patch superfamily enzyme